MKPFLYSAISLALLFGAAAKAQPAEEPSEISATYDVDTDHDGRTDHTIELEQSDSLA